MGRQDENKIKQLTQQIAQLRFVMDQVPNYLFWKDVHSVFMGCNRLFAESAGLASPRDIEGKTDYDLPWSDQESQNYILDDQSVMAAGEPKLNIEETQTINGRKVTLLTSKVPLVDNGEIKGVIGIYSDITELKEAQQALSQQKEAAEKASAVKSNFLAMVSHELRTPLNGILGTVQVMERQYADPALSGFIADIKGAATALSHLVNDILDVSSIEKGRLMIRRGVFELKEVIGSVVDLRHLAVQKGLKLTLQTDLNDTDRFFGDALRLRQVLTNLLNNAIKFTQSGHINVRIDLKEKRGSRYLSFSVEDTGIGIAKDKIEFIFDRFMQVHDKYDRNYEGLGLGLAICRELVIAMHGEINVESTPGKGSAFHFTVPIEFDEGHASQVLLSDYELIQKAKGSVLIVEDNALNRRVLEMMLKEFPLKVTLAENGYEALNYIGSQDVNLVFLDISLPDMDGFEVTRRIRQDKNKEELPIIAVTAHAFESDIIACMQAGMNDVLIKPVNINKLTEKIIQWMVRVD